MDGSHLRDECTAFLRDWLCRGPQIEQMLSEVCDEMS